MLTLTDRQAYQYQLLVMRPYLVAAFQQLGKWKCEVCGSVKGLTFDHKRYAPDITMYDLRVLCWSCHQAKSIANGEAYLSGEFYCPHCPHCRSSY